MRLFHRAHARRFRAFLDEHGRPARGRGQIWIRYARLAAWSGLLARSWSDLADCTPEYPDSASAADVCARTCDDDRAGYRLLARRVADGTFPTAVGGDG